MRKMLAVSVIQPSISQWASASMLIRKKDGQVRWCLDYRRLNNVTRKDVFPLPLIDECLDTPLSERVVLHARRQTPPFTRLEKQSSPPGTACTNLLGWGTDCATPRPFFPGL